ncbi:MAG: hypothetical protein AB8C95_02135 [Phycisphaeraceae bacterium]
MTRLAIASGLCVGIGVFAVLMVQELEAGRSTSALPSDFGTSDTEPTTGATAQGAAGLASLARVDPTKFVPITRDNKHPGQIAPFMRADPYGQMPYQQAAAGEVWEFCAYRLRNASLTDLITHYDKQAKLSGMVLIKQKPTSNNMPGGVVVSWSDGRRGLEVTGWPMRSDQPIPQPPLRPDTPLQWVVKYSYPTQTR